MLSDLRLAELWLDLKLAVGFLTRLPVRLRVTPTVEQQTQALRLYPLVGAGLGALGGLVFWIASGFGLGDLLSALLALLAIVLATGGLHEDGLADTVDGLGCGGDRDRRLSVMRDSHLGSFGALGLFFSLALRAAALIALASTDAGSCAIVVGLIACHAVSRSFFPLTLLLLPPARANGLGADLAPVKLSTLLIALGLGLIIAWLFLGWSVGTLVVLASAVSALVLMALARHKFGGYSGDVLGAQQQVAETVGLMTLVALL